MWGYQHLFAAHAKYEADRVFKALDKRHEPKILLVGLLEDKLADRYSVCLEPEECGVNIESFNQIDDFAKTLLQLDGESRIHQSHPVAQTNQDRRLVYKSYRNGILEILKKECAFEDIENFVSYPTKVEGYQVFVVLQLRKSIINAHYSLTKTHIDERFEISTSFTQSIIHEYLNMCRESLYQPDPGTGLLNRTTAEIYRLAGQHFMNTVGQAGDLMGAYSLYEACNTISSLKYEGADGIGRMLIANKSHKNIRMILELATPIQLRDHRKVRKFLEVADNNSYIISDSEMIYGLGEIAGKYNPKDESLYEISFLNHYQWEVSHDTNVMMTVSYNQPSLPHEKIDKDKFELDIVRIFKNISKKDVQFLWELIAVAIEQPHGTMLVITENAKKEAKRLNNQCFQVAPIRLGKEYFKSVTAIDGAVLLDPQGCCYAIGVILDGKATLDGDSSRGARYNSALRYLKSVKKATLIAIISEDGIINLIPDLKPQIKHSLIEQMIFRLTELEKLAIDKKEFYTCLDFFKENAFYLSQKECDIVNNTKKSIEGKPGFMDTPAIRYGDLKPDSEMDQSYFLKE